MVSDGVGPSGSWSDSKGDGGLGKNLGEALKVTRDMQEALEEALVAQDSQTTLEAGTSLEAEAVAGT